jgi:hypothetical protein
MKKGRDYKMATNYTNTFTVTRNGASLGTLTTPASFDVFASGDVSLTEAVDKTTVYFPNDPIIFTLTITNNLTSSIDLVDIADTIDSHVTVQKYKFGSEAEVTTGVTNTISLLNKTIATGNTVLTITGVIA